MDCPALPIRVPTFETPSGMPSSELLTRALREALSWRLVAELHRRHPREFTVIETHPGGGQYDCLSLIAGNTVLAHLNRVGGFTNWRTDFQIAWEDLWPRCLREDGFGEVLDEISNSLHLRVPTPVPSTRPETIAYRIMAGVSSYFVFDRDHWKWRNGLEDTSGWGNQAHRDRWFEAFPSTRQALQTGSDSRSGDGSKDAFWFLLRSEDPVLCVSRESICFDTSGAAIDLHRLYDESAHSLQCVVAAVLKKL